MIRIGFVHISFPFGGAEKVTLNIAKQLDHREYKVFVFAKKVNYCLLKAEKEVTFVERNSNIAEFINQIKSNKIDVLVFTTACGLSPEEQKEISDKASVKYICIDHGVPFWEKKNKLERIKRKIQTRSFFSKIKYKIYLMFYDDKKESKRIWSYYYSVIDNCDAFIVLCKGYKDEIIDKIGKGKDKIKVIPNGLIKKDIPLLEKQKIVLYAGRVEYTDKRVDRLIDLWKNIYIDFPDWTLCIVGDGVEKKILQKKVENEKIERIVFSDYTNDLSKYYNRASVLCLTSQSESWGLVLTEAQQAGVIPIAFNCSAGVNEILSPSGENGILVAPYDMQEYEKQLRALLLDEVQREKMQKKVINKARSYDMSVVIEQWDELFRTLLNEK